MGYRNNVEKEVRADIIQEIPQEGALSWLYKQGVFVQIFNDHRRAAPEGSPRWTCILAGGILDKPIRGEGTTVNAAVTAAMLAHVETTGDLTLSDNGGVGCSLN